MLCLRSTYNVFSRHNFTLAAEIKAGNIHDSIAFDVLYDEIEKKYTIHEEHSSRQRLQNTGYLQKRKDLVTAYKKIMGKQGYYLPNEYISMANTTTA